MTDLSHWCHDHVFLGARQHIHERRTRVVIGLTATMMVVEIACGLVFGSMALLADGWHMASHTAALGLTAMAYAFARRHVFDPKYSFGTGKVGELAGFSSALLLAVIALLMGYESVRRFFYPVAISFNQAIAVAVVGLFVNIASALILKEDDHNHGHEAEHAHHHTDHNVRAAYLHVMADALTSVLAIGALTAGRFLGWVWMDPFMGLVGGVVISRWSYNLMRDTGRILLDMNTSDWLLAQVRRRIEADDRNRIADLHVWRVGPGHFAAIVSVVTQQHQTPDHFKGLLKDIEQLCHITVEINFLL